VTAFATYSDFRGAVQLMIDGDEVAADIQPQTIDLMISLGEGMVYTGAEAEQLGPLRASTMEAALSVVVASNAAAIPANCLELSAVWFDPTKPLDVVPEEEVRRSLSVGGAPVRKCALAGDSIIFAPAAENGAVLAGRYYAKPVALSTTLHPTFVRFPELFLYAALYASAPFLGFDRRIPVWQAYYRNLLAQANAQERMRAYSGSRLRVRAR
jgi:hypothetical protein